MVPGVARASAVAPRRLVDSTSLVDGWRLNSADFDPQEQAGRSVGQAVGDGRDGHPGRAQPAARAEHPQRVDAAALESIVFSAPARRFSSMLHPHCQQSATSNQSRMEIGAWQSGQAHITDSPSSQNSRKVRGS